MSKAVKQLLKEAKAALGQKQFKIVEEKCQEILKEDQKNYSAYLLLGAIHQDENPPLAIKYLYKATECTTDPIIAYQALMKFVPNDELPSVCQNLLKCAPAKYEEVHKKLESCALVNKTTNACIDILKAEIDSANEEKRVRSAYKCLLEIYMNNTNIDKSWLELFRETLEIAISDRTMKNHIKVFNKYLKILKQLKQYELLLKRSLEMLSMYPNEYIPLDMICYVYVETYHRPGFCFNDVVPTPIATYADEILQMNESSVNALMAKGIYLYETEEYVSARDYLNRANSNSNGFALCLSTLADTHLKLRAFTLAEYCYVASKTVNANYVQSLIEQENVAKRDEAKNVIAALMGEASQEADQLQLLLLKTLIQSNDIDDAKIQEIADSEQRTYLLAYKYLTEGKIGNCLDLLQSNEFETCQYFLLLGQSHFALKQFPEALNVFLRATKLQSYNAECFHWLGKVYMQNGDTDRARKCFEKCVFLNSQHEQSVILLSTIYRQHSEWDSNARILQIAAQAVPNTPCKWAELQLGFHHLGQHHFDEAITAFRAVLRMDATNFASWEGLADSYLKRGSYNSALKVYQKICELNEDNVYPQLQVANIRTTLKLFKEAIESYEELLSAHPDYMPALKGIADAYLGIANQFLEERLISRSKIHAEKAIAFLIKAIQIRNNYICLWRLLANCFDFIAALPLSKAFTQIPGSLANENHNDLVTLNGEKLYEFASRFYCRAIKINSSDISLWYELALNYYNRAIKYGTNETKRRYLNLAAECAKHIIKEAPQKWKYWNLLGVIYTTKEIENLPLAQHCFVKALEIDRKLAVVWTNLGVLYLTQGHPKMANQAFTQSQQSEPNYANAWTGQAQVAEILAPNETIDLLQHSISLGYHDESAIQYAYWICSLLNAPKDKGDEKRVQYYVEHLDAIASASDSITWYCNANDVNVSTEALSFLGYISYVEQHWQNAIRAFQSAKDQVDQNTNKRDKILCNLAYTFLKNNQPEEAVKAFHGVTEATFRSTIGLAYSHFKAKEYESSYAVYENALEWLANDDREKSLILVAMAQMVYAFQGENDAKSVLFQCIGQENSPIEALLSACALGILHNDLQLSELVLKELKKYERTDQWCHHIAFLTSELFLKLNQKRKALLYLYSQVHSFPDKPLLRKVLANFLLNNSEKNEKNLTTANRMVEGTIVMQRGHSKRKMSSMDVSKLLVLASEAMRCIDPIKSKRLVQKAIHANPLCKEAWAARQQMCS